MGEEFVVESPTLAYLSRKCYIATSLLYSLKGLTVCSWHPAMMMSRKKTIIN
jgi:hypothetical protein